MKNLSKVSLFLTVIVIFLFANLVVTSCEKDSSSQSEPIEQSMTIEPSVPELDLKSLVTIENGVLTFKDCEDLKKVSDYLGNPKAQHNILSETFTDFISLNEAYENISKVAAERNIQPNEYEGIAYWSGEGD